MQRIICRHLKDHSTASGPRQKLIFTAKSLHGLLLLSAFMALEDELVRDSERHSILQQRHCAYFCDVRLLPSRRTLSISPLLLYNQTLEGLERNWIVIESITRQWKAVTTYFVVCRPEGRETLFHRGKLSVKNIFARIVFLVKSTSCCRQS
jgi:hypothetical protein